MKHDLLWKGVLEEVIDDLLLFIEPGIGDELDLERGFVFFDRQSLRFNPGRVSIK